MSVANIISTKQTVVGGGVGLLGVTSNEVITYADLTNYAFLGMSLGAWMFLLGFVSVLLIVILNAVKIGGLISLVWKNKDDLSDNSVKEDINKKE